MCMPDRVCKQSALGGFNQHQPPNYTYTHVLNQSWNKQASIVESNVESVVKINIIGWLHFTIHVRHESYTIDKSIHRLCWRITMVILDCWKHPSHCLGSQHDSNRRSSEYDRILNVVHPVRTPSPNCHCSCHHQHRLLPDSSSSSRTVDDARYQPTLPPPPPPPPSSRNIYSLVTAIRVLIILELEWIILYFVIMIILKFQCLPLIRSFTLVHFNLDQDPRHNSQP